MINPKDKQLPTGMMMGGPRFSPNKQGFPPMMMHMMPPFMNSPPN